MDLLHRFHVTQDAEGVIGINLYETRKLAWKMYDLRIIWYINTAQYSNAQTKSFLHFHFSKNKFDGRYGPGVNVFASRIEANSRIRENRTSRTGSGFDSRSRQVKVRFGFKCICACVCASSIASPTQERF